MRKVRILNGEYGGKVVTDTVFPLCKGWKLGRGVDIDEMGKKESRTSRKYNIRNSIIKKIM